MGKTAIEWTDNTINPIMVWDKRDDEKRAGYYCEKVSAACTHCYAEAMNMAQRYVGNGLPFAYTSYKHIRHEFNHARMGEMVRKTKPEKWFLHDTTDIYLTEWVNNNYHNFTLAYAYAAPSQVVQLLTKRTGEMKRHMENLYYQLHGRKAFHEAIEVVLEADREHASKILGKAGAVERLNEVIRLLHAHDWKEFDYPQNLWLGATVENNKPEVLQRTSDLMDTRAAVRFLSIEPLCEDIADELFYRIDHPNYYYGRIHWMIIGGESGPNARPMMSAAMVRKLIEGARKRSIAVFFKQWGDWMPSSQLPEGLSDYGRPSYSTGTHIDFEHLYRVGKKKAGAVIDGQVWKQYPDIAQ